MLEAELQQVKLELEAEKVLCLAHAVDGDKIIADQNKTIGDRDKIIAGQQRTIAELKRNIAIYIMILPKMTLSPSFLLCFLLTVSCVG
jgi:hypothetical protein